MACPITKYDYTLQIPAIGLSLYQLENTGNWIYGYTVTGGTGMDIIQNPSGVNTIPIPTNVKGGGGGNLVIDFTKTPNNPPSKSDVYWQTSASQTISLYKKGTFNDWSSIRPPLPSNYAKDCC